MYVNVIILNQIILSAEVVACYDGCLIMLRVWQVCCCDKMTVVEQRNRLGHLTKVLTDRCTPVRSLSDWSIYPPRDFLHNKRSKYGCWTHSTYTTVSWPFTCWPCPTPKENRTFLTSPRILLLANIPNKWLLFNYNYNLSIFCLFRRAYPANELMKVYSTWNYNLIILLLSTTYYEKDKLNSWLVSCSCCWSNSRSLVTCMALCLCLFWTKTKSRCNCWV